MAQKTIDDLPAVVTPASADKTVLRQSTTDKKLTLDQMVQFVGGIPVGGVIEYTGISAPTGWSFCNYTAVDKTTYADLYAVIAHRYAKTKSDADTADAAGDFHIPDFKDLYLRGGLRETFLAAAITIGTERITIVGHSYTRDGTPVRFFTDDVLPAVITALTNQSWETLYVRVIDVDTIELYDTEAHAIDTSGTTGIIDFADTGTGTHELTQQGIIITDAEQGVHHEITAVNPAGGVGRVASVTDATSENLGSTFTFNHARDYITDGVNGTPRITNETRPGTGFTTKLMRTV